MRLFYVNQLAGCDILPKAQMKKASGELLNNTFIGIYCTKSWNLYGFFCTILWSLDLCNIVVKCNSVRVLVLKLDETFMLCTFDV